MSEPFIGEIRMFPYTFPPEFWARCDGQYMQIGQNPTLYSIIGNTYGGDNVKMGLPNLKGRVPMHAGQGPGLQNYPLGFSSGVESLALAPGQLPQHRHGAKAILGSAQTAQPSQTDLVAVEDDPNTKIFNEAPSNPGALDSMAGEAISREGNGEDHYNMQPYLATPFCIALEGAYPPRN